MPKHKQIRMDITAEDIADTISYSMHSSAHNWGNEPYSHLRSRYDDEVMNIVKNNILHLGLTFIKGKAVREDEKYKKILNHIILRFGLEE